MHISSRSLLSIYAVSGCVLFVQDDDDDFRRRVIIHFSLAKLYESVLKVLEGKFYDNKTILKLSNGRIELLKI